ncbi:hypothetical protein EC912_103397 [Luteibacter rhizovicinus]|uniref:Uncharacterized protein n=1 Tax=Luteibacter rhizovicinus TaxID=242606 RepID=A0A4R3YRA3_9GAMM|nr:hypothetical protein [Luteibacter rhizovicinus]TCV94906.1 hypothetical protein EC912_103397 [Luteibacter rhizovicinus]
MKLLFATTMAAFAAFDAPVVGATSFSTGTSYTEEVLSVAPFRVRYRLAGQTPHGPDDLGRLGLSGDGTVVYAVAGKEIMLHSRALVVAGPASYAWGFDPAVDADPTHPIRSVSSVAGGGFDIEMHGEVPSLRLSSEFVVELKPGFFHDPSLVRLQMVYLADPNAPYIDVFLRADGTQSVFSGWEPRL